jgi:hypothetical protein
MHQKDWREEPSIANPFKKRKISAFFENPTNKLFRPIVPHSFRSMHRIKYHRTVVIDFANSGQHIAKRRKSNSRKRLMDSIQTGISVERQVAQ